MHSGFPHGTIAGMKLKAEKRVLNELILELRALKAFRLRGFVDGQFAKDLKRWLANGRSTPFVDKRYDTRHCRLSHSSVLKLPGILGLQQLG